MDYQINVRLKKGMLDDLDQLVKAEGYMNRSDAARDLIRMGLKMKIMKAVTN